jgi:hypothetical protein
MFKILGFMIGIRLEIEDQKSKIKGRYGIVGEVLAAPLLGVDPDKYRE